MSVVEMLLTQVALNSDNYSTPSTEGISSNPMDGIMAESNVGSDVLNVSPSTLEVRECTVPRVPYSFEDAVRHRLPEKKSGMESVSLY